MGLGRNISQLDVKAGRKVAVIGYAIAKKLFPFTDPIGRMVRVDGRKYEVIGVFEEKKSAFGSHFDNYVLIPVTAFTSVYGMYNKECFPLSVNITVRAKSAAVVQDAIEETTQVLRRERRVKPGEENNFDYYSSESMITQFNTLTAKVKTAIVKEDSLKSAEINVETFKGVVQLSGFVRSQANINTAVVLAKNVNGVKSVKNDMLVK